MRFQIPRSTDFWTGVMFISFGAAALWIAQDYPMGSARRMGPGYFPALLSYGLAGLGLILVVRSMVAQAETIGAITFRPFLVLIAVALFAVLLQPAGVLVSAMVLILVSAYASYEFRLLETLIVAAVLIAFSIAAFVYGLGLPLSVLPNW
jgi:hypothetical protein